MSKKPEVTAEEKKILWAIALGAIEYRYSPYRVDNVAAFLGNEEIEQRCSELLSKGLLGWSFQSRWFLDNKGRRAL